MSGFSAYMIDCPHKGVECFRKVGNNKCELLTWADPKWGHGRSFCSFWKLSEEVNKNETLSTKERDEEIYRLRTECDVPVSKLSEMYGISESYVRTIMSLQRRKHRLKAYHSDPIEISNKRKMAHELLLHGVGITEIARRIGGSPTTVSRWKQKGWI